MADNYISQILTPSGDSYDIKSKITSAIPYGEVDSTSTATNFTATVPGINALYDGVCMLLRNGRVASASGFTININGLGAKPVYNNLASGDEVTPKEATRDTTIFAATYTMLFVYSTTLIDGGCWICYRGYDANTNTLGYQIRTNNGNLQASDTGYKYRLWFTSADNKKWVPANTSTSTNATTSRTMNTRPINPFGPIVYNSTNGTVNSGSRPAVTTLWQQYTLTVGYSYVVSLTAWDPVYVQCTPQTDGSAIMNAIVKVLPTSKDGKIYIYLGMAYSTTAMELRLEHPVFYHDGNGIRAWMGKNASEVVVTPALTSGTKVGDIVVDGNTKTFYAPTPTSITTSAALTSGTKIGTVNATTFYAPTPPTSISQLTNDSGFTTNTGTITKVKTTAGAHSTVDVSSGAVNFNVPTKTSHLTNDSGYITEANIPLATTAAPGIVKPDGSSITISNGVISAPGDGPFYITDGQAPWSIRGVGSSIGSGGQYAAAFGYHSTASGQYSFAEGYGVLASGHRSHAEGDGSVASSYAAHAEGSGTASGYISHAEGTGTASGSYSHAGGIGTLATTTAQTAIGKYNTQNDSALFLVGNGTGTAASARNNAFTVYADGRVASSSSATQSTDLVQLEQLNMALDSIPVLPSAQIISAANSGWGSI